MNHTAYAVLFFGCALARAFYSLIKELFNSEALGICLLAKLQIFLESDTLREATASA